MNEIDEMIKIALQLYQDEHEQGAQMKNGDEFVVCFPNGTLILSVEGKNLQVKLIEGAAYHSDHRIPFFS